MVSYDAHSSLSENVLHRVDRYSGHALAPYFAIYDSDSGYHLVSGHDLLEIVGSVLQADDAQHFAIAETLNDDEWLPVVAGTVPDLASVVAALRGASGGIPETRERRLRQALEGAPSLSDLFSAGDWHRFWTHRSFPSHGPVQI